MQNSVCAHIPGEAFLNTRRYLKFFAISTSYKSFSFYNNLYICLNSFLFLPESKILRTSILQDSFYIVGTYRREPGLLQTLNSNSINKNVNAFKSSKHMKAGKSIMSLDKASFSFFPPTQVKAPFFLFLLKQIFLIQYNLITVSYTSTPPRFSLLPSILIHSLSVSYIKRTDF